MGYSVDRQLREFYVKADESGGLPVVDVEYKMHMMSEVLTLDAGVAMLTPEAAEALDASSKDRLTVIPHSNGLICLTLNSVDDASSFAVCMKVLQVYCKQ